MELNINPGDIAEITSLALAIPTIIYAFGVLLIWGPKAIKGLTSGSIKKTETEWFIIGVCIGFAGGLIDNIYWGLAWGSDFFEMESRDAWFANGVYSNIPFRQLAGTLSAYCHVRAAIASHSTLFRAINILACTVVAAGVGLLFYFRYIF